MSLMTMLEGAQNGRLFAHVADSLDLDEAATRAAMDRLCPAIARQLMEAARSDDGLHQSLLDLIEDGGASPLDQPDGLTGAEGVADGNAILEDIYGTRNHAMVAMRRAAPDLPERELARLAPISATAVVAALARANRPVAAAALPAEARATGDTGLIGTIIGAVIAGAVSGAVRELTSAARRGTGGTTRYTRSRSRSRTAKSKSRTKAKTRTKSKARTGTAGTRARGTSIEAIFRDILGTIGK